MFGRQGDIKFEYSPSTLLYRGVDKWLEQGLIDKGDAIHDYYLNGLKALDEPVKIVDPEWNDWLKENPGLKKNGL